MRLEHVDESLLVQYLLGNLSEPEQVDVEDPAFANSEFMESLESAEADLIDAYVRGELPQDERSAFERQFLTCPNRRSKVEFARALARATLEFKRAVSTSVPVWQTPWRLFRGWHPALQYAAGIAVLTCVAGGAWIIAQNAAMRSRVATLDAQHRVLQTRQEHLQQQLREEQARASRLNAELSNRPGSVPGRVPAIAFLALSPGLSRAGTQVEKLVLQPEVQLARIDIHLEARDDYPRFRAELRSRSGDEVLVWSNLRRRQTGAGFVVSFDVPASALTGGEYELALEGLGQDRPAEDIGYYYFSVDRE